MKKLFFLLLGFLCNKGNVYAQNQQWITNLNLNDNLYISQLSLPGAHDAATGTLSSSTAGKCQDKSLSELWNAGVRVFDLRPYDTENCPIYHGAGWFAANTGINLSDAFTTITGFLGSKPNEFAIVLMRNENDNGSTDNWKNRITAIMNSFPSYVIPFSNNLRYQDVRGKVIVLSRDKFADGYYIGSWGDKTTRDVVWANDDGAFRFVVQDYYQVSNTTTKQNAIKALLDEARTQTSPNFMFINHTSGYSGSLGTNSNIKTNAQNSNKCAFEYINDHPGRTGIIMMDFAGSNNNDYYGADLVNAIITQNNRLVGLNLSTLPDNTDYFLQNVETGLWLQGNTGKTTTSRDGWNTAANMGTYGRPIRIQNYAADGYTLNTQSGPNALGCNYGDANLLYLDGSLGPTKWKFTGTREAAYITINWDRWLSVDGNNRLVNSNSASTWRIWTRAERMAALDDVTPLEPQDVTWLMVNPELMNNDNISPQWTISRSDGNQGWQDGFRPNRVFETWSFSSLDFYQTISGVPNGKYRIRAHAMYSPTGINSTNMTDYNDYISRGDATVFAALYANDQEVKLPSIYSFANNEQVADYTYRNLGSGVNIVDGWWQIARAMGEDDKFFTEPLEVAVTDGTLRIGIHSLKGNPSSNWVLIGSFQMEYLGNIQISEEDDSAPSVLGVPAYVTLTRTLVGGQWNGFSLPFSLSAEQIAASELNGATIKQFGSADGNTITLVDAETIVAGNPYFIKPTDDIVNPSFDNVTITDAEEAVMGTGDYKLAAHLYKTSLPTNGSVAYVSTTNSSIKKLTSGSIKGLRSIFQLPTANGVKPLVVRFGGDADAILSVDADGNITEGAVYNIAGQRVAAPNKGVYIVNGKKMLVK